MVSKQVRHAQNATAESRFGQLASPLMDEAAKQAAALHESADPEVLHKLRVALRRLRTLFWAYRPLLAEDFDERQRALFKFLATSAGSTRDWDILLELLNDLDITGLNQPLQAHRASVLSSSVETIANADVKRVLHDGLKEANHQLNTGPERVPMKRFARKRIDDAQRQLKKRIKRALRAKRSNYAAFHEVRKAGKKVRYLAEFFETDIDIRKHASLKALKRLQKRFGALNDVVASRDLLSTCENELPDGDDTRRALLALKAEQKHRFKAARKVIH
jgi:CHAD domain-containing protein